MPILHTGLESDLRLGEALDQALLVSLTDMAWIGAPELGAIRDLGFVNGTGSDTARVRFAGLNGADHFAAPAAEDTDESETALVDASADIAVARAALVRNIGDLALGTGFADDISAERLAADMVASYRGYYNGLVATAIATASTDVGTSTVDMSVDDFYDAIFQLELSSVPGPYYCMLHPRQFADFQESLRAEGGATQFSPATQEMLKIAGQGFAGSFAGVNVFLSSDVSSAGGNRHGAMWGQGALAHKRMIPNPPVGAGTAVAVRMDELLVEITRDASKGVTEVAGNAYVGVGLIEQARIVGIVTDA